MLRSSSSWQDASGLEQREKGLAGGARGVAMNAPSSLAWMLSEILHGCPVCRSRFVMSLSSGPPASESNRLFEFLGSLCFHLVLSRVMAKAIDETQAHLS